jgi:hypothetical protein
MAIWIALRRSWLDIPSLIEMTKGKLPKASIAINRGTKVNTNGGQLSIVDYSITIHQPVP